LAGCTPHQRLKEVSQKPDERTEEQIRAERHLKQAESLFDKGDAGGAQKEYLAALLEWPMLHKAHLGLGDVYTIEGNHFAAVCEYIAHTEIAPKAKQYLDRMFPYVFGKFSRHPTGPREINDEERAKGMLALSQAVAQVHAGKPNLGLARMDEIRTALPRSGFPEYFEGMVRLALGEVDKAAAVLEEAVAENSYFARRLLMDKVEERIPGLLERLEAVLAATMKKHHSDVESAFMLAVVRYRLEKYTAAVDAVRQALSWGKARWDMLLVKAAAHHKLNQSIKMEQAFADLKAIQPDLSVAFTIDEPSVFSGILAGTANQMAKTRFADSLKEPKRSYFLWRLAQEEKSPDAEKAKQAFFDRVKAKFPEKEFEDLPGTEKPERQPNGLDEFMGAVSERVDAAMPAFAQCDKTRRPERGNPSGRLTIRVELARDGTVGQAGLEENTTKDDWLAYCIVKKIVVMRFPKLIRATETFKIPIYFGPEVDNIGKEKPKGREDPPDGGKDAS
jgi:tetratricopeptide (TPR) repeat protein